VNRLAIASGAGPCNDQGMSVAARYEETITIPRAVRFPIELVPPDGFQPDRMETWPAITGRLEFVEGRLLYLPPCGDRQ